LDGLYDLEEVAYAEDYARIGRSAKAGMDRGRRLVAFTSLLERVLPKLRDVQPGFICEVGGEIVSVVLFSRVGLAGDRHSIETVATHPAHRRQGQARTLIEKAIGSISIPIRLLPRLAAAASFRRDDVDSGCRRRLTRHVERAV